jgi:rod shape-determining protein MreB
MSYWGWKEELERLWTSSLQTLRSAVSSDLVVDLGSANTLIYLPGSGIVLDEPSVIAFDTGTSQVEAVGYAAKSLIGREPQSICVAHPIKDGVIADCEIAGKLLSEFINRAHKQSSLLGPRLLICIPSDATDVEQKAFEEVATRAGAGRSNFIAAPIAAAAGAELEARSTRASMIADIGAGTVDIAVLCRGKLIYSSTLRVGGREMDQAIIQSLRQEHSIEIGVETAETLKIELGSVRPRSEPRVMEAGGRNLIARLPESIPVTDREVQVAIEPIFKEIERGIRAALEEVPPQAAVDLLESGIILSGGLAQLAGLPERLSQEIGLSVYSAAAPMAAVVIGAGRLLEQERGVLETKPAKEMPAPSLSGGKAALKESHT